MSDLPDEVVAAADSPQYELGGMAKGLLIAWNGGTGDEALRSLMALSRGAGKPLVQIPRDLPAPANPAEN